MTQFTEVTRTESSRPDTSERPLRELLAELWEHSETLVRQEFQLALAELDSRVDNAKHAAASAAIGGAVVYGGALSLIAAVILLLAEVIAAWLAALLVGVVLLGVGFMLLKKAQERAKPENLKLERTARNVRRDVHTFQEAVK